MIEDLKRLLIVIQEDSITEASKRLHLTQPAVSHAIKRLESTLNLKLFRRSGKKLILTTEGSIAVVHIERIVKLWDNLMSNTALSNNKMVVLGVYDNAALILAPLFKKYSQNQDMPIELVINNSEKLFTQLLSGVLDMCICVNDPERQDAKNSTLLRSYEERLIPVSNKPIDTPLESIPFLLYNQGSITRKYIDKTFLQYGMRPKIAVESTSPQFIKELAMLGGGVALLPENFILYELEKKRLQELSLPISWSRTVSIFLGSDSDLSQDHVIVKDILNSLKV